MGQSTDAILCYGFRILDEDGRDREGRPEWLNRFGEDVGFGQFLLHLKDPAGNHSYMAGEKAVREQGVDLVGHQSYEYPLYILAAAKSVRRAHRGFPVELGEWVDADQRGWSENLQRFCDAADIECREPQWILCSDWC